MIERTMIARTVSEQTHTEQAVSEQTTSEQTSSKRDRLFNELYERHNGTVHKYVLVSLGFDQSLAEDCMQDIYALLLSKMDRIVEHPNPGGFFIVTARNYIKKYNTARFTQAKKLAPLDERIPARFVEDEVPEDTDLDDIKDILLKKLNGQDSSLYAMFYERDFSVADISRNLNITESNVKVRLFRLRAKVKKMVKEALYADSK